MLYFSKTVLLNLIPFELPIEITEISMWVIVFTK
jgi:hypothetical protein